MVKQEAQNDIFVYNIIDTESWASTPASERKYTEDQVIDAYLKGKDNGIKDYKEFLSSKLRGNMEKAALFTNEVFNTLGKLGIHPENSFMKIEDISYFRILVVVSEVDFLKNEILQAYNIIAEIQDRHKEEGDYDVEVMLCPKGQESTGFDTSCLISDGFHFKYTSK